MTTLEHYWFPWYPARFKAKTMHLTELEELYYRRAIDFYMETKKPLPDNDIALARIVQAERRDFEPFGQMLRQFFKPDGRGNLINRTCDGILSDQGERSRIYSENGKKGGRPKKAGSELALFPDEENPKENKGEKPTAKLNETTGHDRTEDKNNNNQSIQEPSLSETPIDEEERWFQEKFWDPYPKARAGSKDKARVAMKKALKKTTKGTIENAVREYASSDEVARGYAKGAAAWLNDDRWAVKYQPASGRPHNQPKASGMDKIANAAARASDIVKARMDADSNAPWNQPEPSPAGGHLSDLSGQRKTKPDGH